MVSYENVSYQSDQSIMKMWYLTGVWYSCILRNRGQPTVPFFLHPSENLYLSRCAFPQQHDPGNTVPRMYWWVRDVYTDLPTYESTSQES